jgi:hypothetical protein
MPHEDQLYPLAIVCVRTKHALSVLHVVDETRMEFFLRGTTSCFANDIIE